MAKAVLFDVNHTLLGIADESVTQSAAIDVLYGSVCELKKSTLDRLDFRATFDRAWTEGKRASFEKYEETKYEDIVSWVLAQYSLQLAPEELERVLQTYMSPLYDSAYLIQGMQSLINEIGAAAKVGVITNYKYGSGMRGLLERVGLLRLLDSVTISSEVGWKKPDERIYRRALDDLGLEPADIVIVGNELEKDLWRAHSMGMAAILYEPAEHANHDAEFAELLRSRLDLSGMRLEGVATSPSELVALLRERLR